MVDAVEGGHVGQQSLCSADVAVGLLLPDVLLPRLQGQPVHGAAVGIPTAQTDRQTDGQEAPR